MGFRGEVLLHTSMRPNPTALQREAREFFDFCRERRIALPGALTGGLTSDTLFQDCGGIVGSARVVDIVPNGPAPSNPWAIAGWLGLILADVRPLPLIPCKGALGFWNVPADVMAKVDEARKGAEP